MRKCIAEIFVVANYLLLGAILISSGAPLMAAIPFMLCWGAVNGGILMYLHYRKKYSTNLIGINAKLLVLQIYPHVKWFRRFAALSGGVLLFEAFLLSALPTLVILGIPKVFEIIFNCLFWWTNTNIFQGEFYRFFMLLMFQLIFLVPIIFVSAFFERALMGYHVRKLSRKLLTHDDWQDQAAVLEQIVTIELYRKNFSAADAHTKRLNFLNDVE